MIERDPAVHDSVVSARRRGRALVFGAGGVLGFAWTIGALHALRAEQTIDATAADLIIGTSAGSVLAALTGCGVGVDSIVRHQQGVPAPSDFDLDWDYDRDSGGALPPRPGLRPGSPRLVMDAIRHPGRVSPAVGLSGLLPRGRGTQGPMHGVITAASARGLGSSPWPTRPRTWIIGTDYHSGARAVFGRDPVAVTLADAVAASCAIPAWYRPVEISGRSYIDGGTVSNASVDLLQPLVEDGSIEEVYVLAPMASEEPDRPRSPVLRLERAMRRAVTRGIQADTERLRAAGARVVLLSPGPHDLAAMGGNLMNPRYRSAVLRTSMLTSTLALRGLALAAVGAAHPTGPVRLRPAGAGSPVMAARPGDAPS